MAKRFRTVDLREHRPHDGGALGRSLLTDERDPDQMLDEAYARVRTMRTDHRCSDTGVSWNEGYLNGVIEAWALFTGTSRERVTEELHDRWLARRDLP